MCVVVLKKTTAHKRQSSLKGIFNTVSCDAPDNCTYTTVRDMASHNRAFVGLVAGGSWTTQPMKTLYEKVTQARVAALFSLAEEFVKHLEREDREKNIR